MIPGVSVTSLSVMVTPTAATATVAQSLTATVTYSATIKSLASGLLGSNFTCRSSPARSFASTRCGRPPPS